MRAPIRVGARGRGEGAFRRGWTPVGLVGRLMAVLPGCGIAGACLYSRHATPTDLAYRRESRRGVNAHPPFPESTGGSSPWRGRSGGAVALIPPSESETDEIYSDGGGIRTTSSPLPAAVQPPSPLPGLAEVATRPSSEAGGRGAGRHGSDGRWVSGIRYRSQAPSRLRRVVCGAWEGVDRAQLGTGEEAVAVVPSAVRGGQMPLRPVPW